MANNATIAGHVVVGDYAIFGGMAAIHQFCHVGAHAFLGGGSIVVEDVIPYGTVSGNQGYFIRSQFGWKNLSDGVLTEVISTPCAVFIKQCLKQQMIRI